MSAPPSIKPRIRPFGKAERTLVRTVCLAAGAGLVVLLNLVPLRLGEMNLSHVLVDWVTYPAEDGSMVSERNWISVQLFLWLAFFAGMGELWIRRRMVRAEAQLLAAGLLPEDEGTMLASDKLAPLYVRARTVMPGAMLPMLVTRSIKEFRKSLSVERVSAVLNSSLELLQHQLDLRYAALRYLVWILPTLGFLGTVIGIANALAFVGSGVVEPEAMLLPATQRLGVAFHTTLLALVQSAVLMLGMSAVQTADETVLNRCGQYCLDNLVIRLVEPAQISRQ